MNVTLKSLLFIIFCAFAVTTRAQTNFDEPLLFLKQQYRSCQNQFTQTLPTGETIQTYSFVRKFEIGTDGSGVLEFEYQRLFGSGKKSLSKGRMSFNIKDLSAPTGVVKAGPVTSAIKSECASGACVASFSDNDGQTREGRIAFAAFPVCESVGAERLQRAFNDLIRLAGGKTSTY